MEHVSVQNKIPLCQSDGVGSLFFGISRRRFLVIQREVRGIGCWGQERDRGAVLGPLQVAPGLCPLWHIVDDIAQKSLAPFLNILVFFVGCC